MDKENSDLTAAIQLKESQRDERKAALAVFERQHTSVVNMTNVVSRRLL